jgi:heme A synthase
MLDTVAKLILAIGLIILVAALGPWLVIWSLNTLFPALAIEFTFWTWCAVILLYSSFRANVTVKRRD